MEEAEAEVAAVEVAVVVGLEADLAEVAAVTLKVAILSSSGAAAALVLGGQAILSNNMEALEENNNNP